VQKLTIGIDIDATLTVADYWIPWVNRHLGRELKAEDVTEYEIEKILGITEDEFWELYELDGESLHADSAVRSEASEVLTRLSKNHQLHYVTARHPKMREVTLKWLHLHQIPCDGLHLLGSHNKVASAHQLGCDLFIEDRYENALAIAASGIKVLLMDCFYNRDRHLPHNIIRIMDWYQAEKAVQVMEKTGSV
jgi:uncharacterized protein